MTNKNFIQINKFFSKTTRSIYFAFSRIGWAAAVAWVIVANHLKWGGLSSILVFCRYCRKTGNRILPKPTHAEWFLSTVPLSRWRIALDHDSERGKSGLHNKIAPSHTCNNGISLYYKCEPARKVTHFAELCKPFVKVLICATIIAHMFLRYLSALLFNSTKTLSCSTFFFQVRSQL